MNDVKFMNLTPHDITVYKDGVVVLTIPPEAVPARRDAKEEVVGEVNGIKLVRTIFGPALNVPAPVEGVVYIVSRLVKDDCLDRPDVLCPDTGKTAVRILEGDDKGKLIGVTQFTY